jgi:cell division transport system permease protein
LTSANAGKAAAELRPNFLVRFFQGHAREVVFTLGRFYRNLSGALLTCFVIGITLALPAALHTLVGNVNALGYSWETTLQASLFLKDKVTPEQGQALAQQLRARSGVAETAYLSREQSLEEFKALSGLGQALDLLESNPLPAVITVTPAKGIDRAALDSLVVTLGQLPEVEVAKLDRRWLERLYGVLDLVQRLVLLIAGVLSLAVIVIVGNTIRLDIEAKRAEIEVMKLIGATNGFIRRPFLYTGLWYGLVGGAIAWGLVQGMVIALSGPAASLAGLYGSGFRLQGLPLDATAIMFAAGILLGWLGAGWTVSRHLRGIEPR